MKASSDVWNSALSVLYDIGFEALSSLLVELGGFQEVMMTFEIISVLDGILLNKLFLYKHALPCKHP